MSEKLPAFDNRNTGPDFISGAPKPPAFEDMIVTEPPLDVLPAKLPPERIDGRFSPEFPTIPINKTPTSENPVTKEEEKTTTPTPTTPKKPVTPPSLPPTPKHEVPPIISSVVMVPPYTVPTHERSGKTPVDPELDPTKPNTPPPLPPTPGPGPGQETGPETGKPDPKKPEPKKHPEGSLLANIERAQEVNRGIASNKSNPESSWIRSVFNTLKMKMGWSGDVISFSNLGTEAKVSLAQEGANDVLIERKKGEVAHALRKLQEAEIEDREGGGKLIVDDLARLDKAIAEAERDKNEPLKQSLMRAKEGLESGPKAKKDLIESEKTSLQSQLERYKDRKVAIIEDFIAGCQIRSENIRNKTGYYENLHRRSEVNNAIERSQDVILKTEQEIINLKKALAFNKNSADKKVIKESIKEYQAAISESRSQLARHEKLRGRLTKFIDYTDKRTKRFEDVKKEHLKRRDEVVQENKGITPPKKKTDASTPPSLPPTPTPKPASSAGGKTETPPTTPAPKEAPKTASKEEKPDLEVKRKEKISAINQKLERLKILADSKTDVIDELKGLFKELDNDLAGCVADRAFNGYYGVFKEARKDISKFVSDISRPKDEVTKSQAMAIAESLKTFSDNFINNPELNKLVGGSSQKRTPSVDKAVGLGGGVSEEEKEAEGTQPTEEKDSEPVSKFEGEQRKKIIVLKNKANHFSSFVTKSALADSIIKTRVLDLRNDLIQLSGDKDFSQIKNRLVQAAKDITINIDEMEKNGGVATPKNRESMERFAKALFGDLEKLV